MSLELYKCANCGEVWGLEFKYCPNCGDEDLILGYKCECCEKEWAYPSIGICETCIEDFGKMADEFSDRKRVDIETVAKVAKEWADRNW